MQTKRVPDAAQRKELSEKALRVQDLYLEACGGEWYDKGDEASHTFNWENLSPEAKRVIPKNLNEVQAQHKAAMATLLSEWASKADTEGQPIPHKYDEIMELIDSL